MTCPHCGSHSVGKVRGLHGIGEGFICFFLLFLFFIPAIIYYIYMESVPYCSGCGRRAWKSGGIAITTQKGNTNPEKQSTGQSPEGSTAVPPVCETPPVPGIVRVYGMIIMVCMVCIAIGIGLVALKALVGLVGSGSSLRVQWLFVFGAALSVAISLVIFRLGEGLRAGQRQAVYGLCILGGIALLLAIGNFLAGQVGVAVFFLAVVGVLYVPPIISAHRHWSAFK
jgi:hypothetical protein